MTTGAERPPGIEPREPWDTGARRAGGRGLIIRVALPLLLLVVAVLLVIVLPTAVPRPPQPLPEGQVDSVPPARPSLQPTTPWDLGPPGPEPRR